MVVKRLSRSIRFDNGWREMGSDEIDRWNGVELKRERWNNGEWKLFFLSYRPPSSFPNRFFFNFDRWNVAIVFRELLIFFFFFYKNISA